MPHWSEPLVVLLAEQPADTTSVTLTIAELMMLAGGRLPAMAETRSYWWTPKSGSMVNRLAAIGWRAAHVRGRPLALTFERVAATNKDAAPGPA